MSIEAAYDPGHHNFHHEFSKELTHSHGRDSQEVSVLEEDDDDIHDETASNNDSPTTPNSRAQAASAASAASTPAGSPSVPQYTDNIAQLVEAKILSRLETEAGRQILLAEAVYYNNDLDAARAAIVRCAKKKVKRRLRVAVDQNGRDRSGSNTSNTSSSSRRRARSGDNNNSNCTRASNNEVQAPEDNERVHNRRSRPGTISRSGSVLGENPHMLNDEIAAEAEALGLRAEDIPFKASDLSKISGRRMSREPNQMADSAAAAALAAAAAASAGPDDSPSTASSAAASPERPAERVGSGRGPVFLRSLESALACNKLPLRDNEWVPDVVKVSLDYLNKHALTTEGLWRIPGSIGKVKEYKIAWDAGLGVAYADEETRPHDVCSLLLMYFRELPGTIFGANMASEFVNDQDMTSEDEIVDRLSGLVGMLKQANRDTLNAMIHHFMLLSQNSSENMMTSENIATCVWASQGYYQSMKHMIDNYDLIFYMYSM